MRICLLIDSTDIQNGYGRYASGLIAVAREAGHEIFVPPNLRRGWRSLFDIPRLRSLIKSADVVHALDVYPFCIVAWLANIGIRKPLALSMQGTYSVAPFYQWPTAWFARRAIRSARAITAISRYTRDRVSAIVPGLDIQIINHGFWYKDFAGTHAPHGTGLIVSVGALKYRKGFHIALPAFAAAYRRAPHLRYSIVGSQGDRAYTEELKGLVREHGIEDVVDFRQGISDQELRALYARAEVFLLPSVNQGNHFEGFGLVFLEAAAAGVPAVGTLGNGIADAIDDGKSGVLVPQGDIQATADAILDVISDQQRWKSMSEHSQAWARSHDWSHIGPKYLQIYSELHK